jgi:hypothetical protein
MRPLRLYRKRRMRLPNRSRRRAKPWKRRANPWKSRLLRRMRRKCRPLTRSKVGEAQDTGDERSFARTYVSGLRQA